MSIGVASVQRKEFNTASAVYYREQRFAAERCSSSSSRPSILTQCLASTNLEQYLSSGTVPNIRNSGTTMA